MRRGLVSVVVVAALAATVGTAALLGTALRATTPSRRAACTPTWHIVARTGVRSLTDVVALSADRVWAVGGAKVGGGAARPVIVHWNGRKLDTRVLPWKGAVLTGVTAVSPGDVWAVGNTSGGPLVTHWNSSVWYREKLPPLVHGRLADVIAVASDDVWAVGADADLPLVMHSDGRRWTLFDMKGIAPRNSELTSIDVVSPDDVWAVGPEGLETAQEWLDDRDLVLRWDGAGWRRASSPLLAAASQPNFAQAVDVSPSGEVWTVNQYSDDDPWFVRWGTGNHSSANVDSWSKDTDLATGPIVQVADMEAVSSTEAWVVGRIDWAGKGWDDLADPLIGHWDGRSWLPQHIGLEGLKGTGLSAISAVSATDIWAVGSDVVVRYSC